MALFVSDRERRLWAWTLAVVAAIFSTLNVTPTVTGFLRERALLDASFVVGLLLVGTATVALALRVRPRGVEVGVALGVAAVYLLLLARMGLPEERTHLIEYGVVAAFIYQALLERRSHGRHVGSPAGLAVAFTTGLGWLDEGVQAVLPDRFYDIRDVGFNAFAGVLAVAGSMALRRARRLQRSIDP